MKYKSKLCIYYTNIIFFIKKYKILIYNTNYIIYRYTYPLRQAMCKGNEQAPLFKSVLRDNIHLTISTLLIPTHFCNKLYPSSLCTTKIFSLCKNK